METHYNKYGHFAREVANRCKKKARDPKWTQLKYNLDMILDLGVSGYGFF